MQTWEGNVGRISEMLLEIENLEISFPSIHESVFAVQGLDLALIDGDSVAIVGESGSGKSVSVRSILGLIESPPAYISGKISYKGIDIINASDSTLRQIRGKEIAMIFQDSLDSLNPVYTVGSQLIENLMIRLGLSKSEAKEEAIQLMKQVEIPAAEDRLYDYPHQFSGGMRQRINIAMAISLKPRLLIADEPTTALDVTVQAGILRLIKNLQQNYKMGLIFVTHDLSVARIISERLLVMYSGRVMEQGPVDEVFSKPMHPYSRALLESHPNNVNNWRNLQPIAGKPPENTEKIKGCCFHPRCPYVKDVCRFVEPELILLNKGHTCRCHFPGISNFTVVES